MIDSVPEIVECPVCEERKLGYQRLAAHIIVEHTESLPLAFPIGISGKRYRACWCGRAIARNDVADFAKHLLSIKDTDLRTHMMMSVLKDIG